jgi:hypothetical protein
MENESLNNEKLIALFNNLNMLAKLQTQKLNEFGQKLDLILGEFNKKFELMFENLNSNHIKNEEVDFPEAIIPPIEEYKNNLKTNSQIVETKLPENKIQEEKKYFVQQKLFFEKTKSSIVGADITIINSENKRVKIKSMPNGKWRAALAPGEYTIEISRPPMKDGPAIQNVNFQISVKESFKPIDLGDKYL